MADSKGNIDNSKLNFAKFLIGFTNGDLTHSLDLDTLYSDWSSKQVTFKF